MIFKTKSGEVFTAVPNNSFCTQLKKHPYFMERCPINKVKNNVDVCIPEDCEFFKLLESSSFSEDLVL